MISACAPSLDSLLPFLNPLDPDHLRELASTARPVPNFMIDNFLRPDFADRDTQHELVSGWTGHAGLASMNDLSVAEAADAIRGAQDAVDRAKQVARA